MSDHPIEQSVPSQEVPQATLEALIDTLTPQELRTHEELAAVYHAAGNVVLCSYRGGITTSPVENLTEERVGLMRRLLLRYEDEQGFTRFPIFHPGGHTDTPDEVMVSGGVAERYRLISDKDPGSGANVFRFTSFPNLSDNAKKE